MDCDVQVFCPECLENCRPPAIARFKPARVSIDYHVELDGHYYSVPHRLVGERVELRITATTVEVLHGQSRVAAHALNPRRGAHSTTPEHMPASHREHLQWTPSMLIAWGERIGSATAAVVRWQMEHRDHPEPRLPVLSGPHALGAQVRRRALGGRLHPRAGVSLTDSQEH